MLWKQINSIDTQSYSSKLRDIATILLKNKNLPENNIGLMGGKAGIVLFLFYYAKLVNKQEPYDSALELLTSVFEEINKGFNYHTHAAGLAGIGTVMEILTQEDLIDADTDDLLGEMDVYVYNLMQQELKNKNYDFLHGAVGTGLYFLKRLSSRRNRNYLIRFVDMLEEIADVDDEGTRWVSVLNREKDTKGYNLSLSHGLASIITFLSKLYITGIAKEKVSKLLAGSVEFLLNQQLDISKNKFNFPSWVCKEEPAVYSRLAWCYGDLGIGIALWQAGNNTNTDEWKNKAVEILLHSTQRRSKVETDAVDAGLCHGTSGIAHIYNRMYHYTGKENFKEAALYWFDETLKMAKFDDGLAGFKAWRTPKHGGLQNEYGFLEGIAGIGLTLISVISDTEPNWDECLLLS